MNEKPVFSSLAIPLSGTSLIEASAGTGKTHTITELFLRLLLEKKFAVNEILIVTFTDAATKELRDRTRKKLRQTLNLLSSSTTVSLEHDPFTAELINMYSGSLSALQLLEHALANFDEAAIFTIHGFCLQVLTDLAFESGTPFDVDLIESQDLLVQESVDDFWRLCLSRQTRLFISYMFSKKSGPAEFLRLVSSYISNPSLQVIPRLDPPDTEENEKAFREVFNQLSALWSESHNEITDFLFSNKFDGRKYRHAWLKTWIDSLDSFLKNGVASVVLPDKFEKFTQSALAEASRNDSPPDHPFFMLCECLLEKSGLITEGFEEKLVYLKSELFGFVRKEIQRKKNDRNVQYFDDLLLRVNRGIKGPSGLKLISSIHSRFRAALIDEFQDTDPVQYEIFDSIFNQQKRPLILIGDPKQAIYSFRSADIFTYLNAARNIPDPFCIDTNWRAEPELVHALNLIFSGNENPFILQEIEYKPVLPCPVPKLQLKATGVTQPPFHLWFFHADKARGKVSGINKPDMLQTIACAVANETARLLNSSSVGQLHIGDSPLCAGDIAVLVRTHLQARIVQKEMIRRRIPCILYNTGYIFETEEAEQVFTILRAIANPGDETVVRAALATDMMGLQASDLLKLEADEPAWEKILVQFRNYHDRWTSDGFYCMFSQFLLEQGVKQRLVSLPSGERRITNLLHISEFLHKQSEEVKHGMRGLLKWLAEQIHPDTPGLEEHMLRLESDDAAVKIVTIHKSKGLEYPVVFCPFAGFSSVHNQQEVLFHDSSDCFSLKLDLGSPEYDAHKKNSLDEALAEDMRLLYVALTRASNRCYLAWGGFKSGERSALAHLFHNTGHSGQSSAARTVQEVFKDLSDAEIMKTMKGFEQLSEQSIVLRKIGPEEKTVHLHRQDPQPDHKALACRKFSSIIKQQWSTTSFSSLVSVHKHDAEIFKTDEFTSLEQTTDPLKKNTLNMFSFPCGAGPGTMLHDVLEHLEFSLANRPGVKKLVSSRLAEYGFDLKWTDTIVDMLTEVLSVPLDPLDNSFVLSRIPESSRCSEMDFYFPLKRTSKEALRDIFARHGSDVVKENFPSLIDNLTFSPTQGFMKGYIDLVFQYNNRFYLIDWKSNLLGANLSDYSQNKLQFVMERDFYMLQYHLYCMALDQYLCSRMPKYSYNEHFGGVFYLFLRGVRASLGTGCGIYRDRPSETLINEMKSRLLAS